MDIFVMRNLLIPYIYLSPLVLPTSDRKDSVCAGLPGNDNK